MQNVGRRRVAPRECFRVNHIALGKLLNCTWKLATARVFNSKNSTKMSEHFAKERFAAEFVMRLVTLYIPTPVFFPVELRLAPTSETMQLYKYRLKYKGDAMDIATILTSLISGGVGGNIAGSLLKKLNLGPLGNTIAGVIGGGVGGMAMNNMMGATDMTSGVLGNIAGSGIGGAVVMIVIGLIKNAMNAKKIGTTTSTTTTNTTNMNTVTKENPQPMNFKKNPPPKSRDYSEGPRP
jgi:hypothetical protein